jgi:hypothetical protein
LQQRDLFDANMHALARADACAAPPPRFAGLAPAPLAVSLASSDSACSINRTLWHALDFLAPSTRLVVHIGCGSPATTEERKALGAISPRVLVNPRCESVDPKDGTPSPSPWPRPGSGLESTTVRRRPSPPPLYSPSATTASPGTLLHAHLLNVRLLSAAPPHAVLLASADMRWLAPGVEALVSSRTSSVYGASYLPWEQAFEAIPPNRRAATPIPGPAPASTTYTSHPHPHPHAHAHLHLHLPLTLPWPTPTSTSTPALP